MTLLPEQDAAVRKIVAEMLAKALNGTDRRIRGAGGVAAADGVAAVRRNLLDPAEAIAAAVDEARAQGDLSQLTDHVRRLLGMRISDMEARKAALELAAAADAGNHIELARSFYAFLTGQAASGGITAEGV